MKRRVYIILTMLLLSLFSAVLLMSGILTLMKYEVLDKKLLYGVFIMNDGLLYISSLVGVMGGYRLGDFWYRIIYIDKKHRIFKTKR